MYYGSYIVVFSLGFFCGCLFLLFFRSYRSEKNAALVAKNLSRDVEEYSRNLDKALSDMKENFQTHSRNAVSQSTEVFVKETHGQMSSNRQSVENLIDKNQAYFDNQVSRMVKELDKVVHHVIGLDKSGREKMTELSSLLSVTNLQTKRLMDTTSNINQVLTQSQSRGQWGERLAEDILKYAGFVENINYKKQVTLKTGLRPDYTFILPNNLHLHMDVKFPIENYRKYLTGETIEEKNKFIKLFISDMRVSLKDLCKRNYIDPESTVNCVLVFIPHEQIFSFFQEHGSDLFDYALENNIIPCSPLTLFAVLAVVRKACDNFTLEKKSHEILAKIEQFKKQWLMYHKSFEDLGKKISDLSTEYDKISTTRTRQLNRSFEKLEDYS
tara:strand:+ start:1124 stop:2275 length:1152 start_codon:yes stop_codon:yes gene_type:complete